jgi:hypothetical protein
VPLVPGKEGSPYREYESSPAWMIHTRRLDELWSSFEKTRLPRMLDFQRRELAGPPISDALVFYPFGGPDVLTVYELFSARNEYILASLEPPGTVPSFKKSHLEHLDRQLPLFGDTMQSLFTKSFFVTREMDRQLRGQVTDGLVPLLLVQLVRTGNTILRYGYTGLDETGRMVRRPGDKKRAAWGGNRGVAIEFQKEGGGPKRILHYISVNLDNKHLARNPQFLKYVAALDHPVTMLKATSYMVHKDEFSIIRDTLLSHSAAIVQDDSGVPFRMFDPDRWKIQLYGEYKQPFGSFKFLKQRDLEAAYHKTGVKPLDLRMGYGWRKAASNLLVARRKN